MGCILQGAHVPLTQRKPVNKRRPGKARRGSVKDEAYLEWLRGRRCVVCIAWGLSQSTPTEAAHVGARGLGQKCDDREALPMCESHHRTGKLAHHVLGKWFWVNHGIDRDEALAAMHALYGEEKLCPVG